MSGKLPKFEGGEFLKEKYWKKKEFREPVEKTLEKEKRLEEEFIIPQKPEEKIPFYLERLEKIIETKGSLLKELSLYPRLIIKSENISEDYLKNILLGNFAEGKGYTEEQFRNEELRKQIIELFKNETGQDFKTYQIPKEEREQIIEQIIRDQKTSLDRWFEYLISSEAEHYPETLRYWAFAEMTKLGVFDISHKEFTMRTPKTVAPFPELNHQALALVLGEVQRKYLGQPSQLMLTDEQKEEFQKRLKSESFGKLYAWILDYVRSLEFPPEQLKITEGEWELFPKGSNPQELVKRIEGFNTGWCIANLGTAESYLSRSDILVYFSKDKKGENTIPRTTIVTDGHRISEVRGILQTEKVKQHLDNYIVPIVAKKLEELSGGVQWQKTIEDMKKLARIHFKYLQEQPLTLEELRFLYEIDGPIKGTGYGKDPRIEEILARRNIKEDLSYVLGILPEKISLTQEEALKGDIIFHYGDLDLGSLASAKGLELPESIGGYLNLERLTSAKGLELPESIGGYLNLERLTSAKGLKLPESIRGDLSLEGLTSAEGLELPESIGGSLYLGGLTSPKGLELPKSIRGNLDLESLTSAEGLELPESVGGYLNLERLTSAEGLKLPKSIGGNLSLEGLTSAEGLELPESVGGSVYFEKLPSTEIEKLKKQYPHLKIKVSA